MKKILYIGNNLSNSTSNTTAIQRLGAQLEREGHQIKYASAKSNKVLRLLDMLGLCFKNRRWADALLIDTYSTQNFYYALVVSQLCRLIGLPYIPILHGGDLPNRLEQNPRLSQLIFENSKVNISPSKYLQLAFQSKGYDVVHIPNSIEIMDYELKEKNFVAIRLFWLRSFSKIYNPEMAISVVKLLQDQGHAVSLCMVGPEVDGSMNACKVLANKLNVHVEFTGKLAKQDWLRKASACNVFINTTNFDNMPVSVLEAMALGFPIISTNVGGLSSLIEDGNNGILVAKDDTKAMTKAVLKVISDSELRTKLSQNARAKAEYFDWSNVKLKWQKVL